MLSFPLVSYVLKAALRDKLIWIFAAAIFVALSMSLFMGSTAIMEKSSFSVVFMASSLRLLIIFGLTLFIAYFIRRSFDNRDVEYLLARPVSRLSYIVSHSVAFSVLAALLAASIAFIIFAFLSTTDNLVGGLYWAGSVILEAMSISLVAMFFAMFISTATGAVLAVIGFYILCRMSGELLGAASYGFGDGVLNAVLHGVSLILPRFDLAGQTSWLMYGAPPSNEILLYFLQQPVFMLFILLASIIEMKRKEF